MTKIVLHSPKIDKLQEVMKTQDGFTDHELFEFVAEAIIELRTIVEDHIIKDR